MLALSPFLAVEDDAVEMPQAQWPPAGVDISAIDPRDVDAALLDASQFSMLPAMKTMNQQQVKMEDEPQLDKQAKPESMMNQMPSAALNVDPFLSLLALTGGNVDASWLDAAVPNCGALPAWPTVEAQSPVTPTTEPVVVQEAVVSRPSRKRAVAAPAPAVQSSPVKRTARASGKQRASKRSKPETQRAKRAAMGNQFNALLEVCGGPAEAPTRKGGAARGERSSNSKQAILKRAGQRIAQLRAEIADLEEKMANTDDAPVAAPAPRKAVLKMAPLQPVAIWESRLPGTSYSQVFGQSSAPRCLTGLDGRLLDYNQPFAALFDIPMGLYELPVGVPLCLSVLLPFLQSHMERLNTAPRHVAISTSLSSPRLSLVVTSWRSTDAVTENVFITNA